MVSSIPPLMVFVPTTLALGIQFPAAVLCLATAFAVVMDCFIEPCFRLFDRMLAPRPVICVEDGGRGDEQQKPHRHD